MHKFKSRAMLSSTIKSRETQDANHPLVQHLCSVDAPCLVIQQPSWLSDGQSQYLSACVQATFALLHKGPKRQSSDAGWQFGYAKEKEERTFFFF